MALFSFMNIELLFMWVKTLGNANILLKNAKMPSSSRSLRYPMNFESMDPKYAESWHLNWIGLSLFLTFFSDDVALEIEQVKFKYANLKWERRILFKRVCYFYSGIFWRMPVKACNVSNFSRWPPQSKRSPSRFACNINCVQFWLKSVDIVQNRAYL